MVIYYSLKLWLHETRRRAVLYFIILAVITAIWISYAVNWFSYSLDSLSSCVQCHQSGPHFSSDPSHICDELGFFWEPYEVFLQWSEHCGWQRPSLRPLEQLSWENNLTQGAPSTTRVVKWLPDVRCEERMRRSAEHRQGRTQCHRLSPFPGPPLTSNLDWVHLWCQVHRCKPPAGTSASSPLRDSFPVSAASWNLQHGFHNSL